MAINALGLENVINGSEGVLFAEISALADDLTRRTITIKDSGGDTRVYFRYHTVSNQIRAYCLILGAVQCELIYTLPGGITNYSRIAFKYKQDDFALWVNGTEVATDTSGNTPGPNTLDSFHFDNGSGSETFYGRVKQVAVFDRALTNAELGSLTQ